MSKVVKHWKSNSNYQSKEQIEIQQCQNYPRLSKNDDILYNSVDYKP
jgi:hypothetical protein